MKFINFPPISAKCINSPYFLSIDFIGLIYLFLLPPYFDHAAFMHHALHVLDAPEQHEHLENQSGEHSYPIK